MFPFETPSKANSKGRSVAGAAAKEGVTAAKEGGENQTTGAMNLLPKGENKPDLTIARGPHQRRTTPPPVRAIPEVQLPYRLPPLPTISIQAMRQSTWKGRLNVLPESTARQGNPTPTPGVAPVTPAPLPEQQQERTPSSLDKLIDNRVSAREPKPAPAGWLSWPEAADNFSKNKFERASTPYHNRSTLALYVHEKFHTSQFEETTDHEAFAVKPAPAWIPQQVQHEKPDPVAINSTKPPASLNHQVILQSMQKAIRWDVNNDGEEPETQIVPARTAAATIGWIIHKTPQPGSG